MAQRARRHLRRGARGPVVRPGRDRDPGAQPVAASLGAQVGRGVWCETYWLPEADLVHLRDGVTVNAGCVVQTHLFHDRVLSMDTVTLRAGRHPRSQQRDPARGDARAARYGRPGVAGDERRVGARQDPLDRQPHRPLGRRRLARGHRVSRDRTGTPTRTSPGTATASTTSRTTTWTSTTASRPTGSTARPSLDAVALTDLDRLASTCTGSRSTKVASRARVAEVLAEQAQADRPAARADRRAGERFAVSVPTPATRPLPSSDRRRGLGGARRRRDRRRTAPRRPLVVPVQRPAGQQGVLPDQGHRRQRLPVVANGPLVDRTKVARGTTWVYVPVARWADSEAVVIGLHRTTTGSGGAAAPQKGTQRVPQVTGEQVTERKRRIVGCAVER